jgi:restriction system protein
MQRMAVPPLSKRISTKLRSYAQAKRYAKGANSPSQRKVTIVQCKRWSGKPVPVQVMRELYGVLHDRGATSAKLVATTAFTPDAIAFATGKPIELVDSNALLQLLRNVQTSGKIIAPSAETERDHLAPDCPWRGSEMTLRTAKRGANIGEKFWGCPKFPECRGTRPL